MKDYLNLLLTLSLFIIGALAFASDLEKEFPTSRVAKFLNNLTFKFWFFALAIFIGGVAAQWKEKDQIINDNYNDSIAADKILKISEKYSNKADSTVQAKAKEYIEALALYGYKYDSSEKIIRRLISDSAKRFTTINYGSDPFFSFATPYDSAITVKHKIVNSRKNTVFYNIKFHFINALAPSRNHNFTIYVVGVNEKGKYFFGDSLITKLHVADKDHDIDITRSFILSEIDKGLFFYVQGLYKNSDLTKTYSINDILYYSASSGVASPSLFLEEEVVALLKSKGVAIK